MPPLVVPDALQVVCKGQAIDRPWTSVYGLVITDPTPLDEAGADDIRDLFIAYYTALAPLRDDSWDLLSIQVTDIREVGGPQFDYSTPVAGTGVGSPMPPDMAICVSWLTNRRGGSFRGRTYHNGFTEEGMDQGRLGADELADEQAAADDFIASFPGGLALGIISRTLLEVNVVTTARVNDVFDHQTRRRFPQ